MCSGVGEIVGVVVMWWMLVEVGGIVCDVSEDDVFFGVFCVVGLYKGGYERVDVVVEFFCDCLNVMVNGFGYVGVIVKCE